MGVLQDKPDRLSSIRDSLRAEVESGNLLIPDKEITLPSIQLPGVDGIETRDTFLDAIGEGSKSLIRGLLSVPGDVLDGIGILQERVSFLPFQQDVGRAISLTGQAIKEFAEEAFPGDLDKQDSFFQTLVPEAIGQGIGFIGVGLLTGGFGNATRLISTASTGAFVSASHGYNNAIARGASEEDAFKRYILGLGIGATEAIPINHLLSRLDKAAGGGIKRAIIDASINGSEEAVQEFFQTFLDNAADALILDDEGDLFEGAFTGGKVGATSGGVLGFATSILVRKARRGRARRASNAISKAGPSEIVATEKDQIASEVREETTEGVVEEEAENDNLFPAEQAKEETAPPPSIDNPLRDDRLFYVTTTQADVATKLTKGLDQETKVNESAEFTTDTDVVLIYDKRGAAIERDGDTATISGGKPRPFGILVNLARVGTGVTLEQLKAAQQEAGNSPEARAVFDSLVKQYETEQTSDSPPLSLDDVIAGLQSFGLPIYGIQIDSSGKPVMSGQLFKPDSPQVDRTDSNLSEAQQETLNEDQTDAFDDLMGRIPPDDSGVDILESFGLTKEMVNKIRIGFGLNELPASEGRTWVAAMHKAITRGYHQSAETIAARVIADPRPISDAEYAGLLVRGAELSIQHQKQLNEAEDHRREGRLAEAELAMARSNEFREALDALTYATDIASSETGRALNIRRLAIDAYKFDAASLLNYAENAKTAELTTEEQDKIAKISKKVTDQQVKVQDLSDHEKELLEKESIRLAEEQVKAEKKAIKSEEQRIKERNRLMEEIKKGGFNLFDITGIPTDILFKLGRIALTYVRSPDTTLQEVTDIMMKRLQGTGITAIDLYEAINTSNPKIKKKSQSAIEARKSQIKTEARLNVEIDKAIKGIFDPKRKRKPTGTEIKRLQKTLRELRKFANDSERNQEKLAIMNEKISELQRLMGLPEIRFSDLSKSKNLLTDLRQLMKTKEEISDLKKSLEEGTFTPEDPVRPRPRLKELELARLELKELKDEARRTVEALKPFKYREFRNLGQEPWKAVRSAVGAQAPHYFRLPITLQATADMSMMFRQALILSARATIDPTRRRIIGAAWRGAFRSFWSKHDAFAIDMAQKQDPMELTRLKYKLFRSPLEIGSLTSREELFSNKLSERIPIWNKIIRMSERHMVVGLNMMRNGIFDEFVRNNPGLDDAQYFAIADYINKASGRGHFSGTTAQTLSHVFFAPRFAISRFQTPVTLLRYWKHPQVRREIAYDMSLTVGQGMIALGIASVAGAIVGDDPRDSDFGKIVIGNTRVDIWGGFLQPARLIGGVAAGLLDRTGLTGQHLPENMRGFGGTQGNVYDMIADFTFYKAAPLIHVPATLIQGKNVVGEEQNAGETLARTIAPLFMQEVYDAYKIQGIQGGVIAAPTAFVGVGVSSYGDALKRGDVKQTLRRAGFRPRRPKYPEWVEELPRYKKQMDEIFALNFAVKLQQNQPIIDILQEGEETRDYLKILAAESRFEVNAMVGKIGRQPPPRNF